MPQKAEPSPFCPWAFPWFCPPLQQVQQSSRLLTRQRIIQILKKNKTCCNRATQEPSTSTLHLLALPPFSADSLLQAAAAEILRCSPSGHRESPRLHPAVPWPTPETATQHT